MSPTSYSSNSVVESGTSTEFWRKLCPSNPVYKIHSEGAGSYAEATASKGTMEIKRSCCHLSTMFTHPGGGGCKKQVSHFPKTSHSVTVFFWKTSNNTYYNTYPQRSATLESKGKLPTNLKKKAKKIIRTFGAGFLPIFCQSPPAKTSQSR